MCQSRHLRCRMTVKTGVPGKCETAVKAADGFLLKLKLYSLIQQFEKRRFIALLVCIASVVFDLALAVAAFICAASTSSSAGYAFALDCLLDAIAASLLVWRFYGTSAAYSDDKEKITCISLGILFCLASLGIIGKSVHDLAARNIPEKLMFVFILAGIGGFVNCVLGLSKYALGKKMSSPCLILEAVNTLLSAFLALTLAVSDSLYFYHPSAWTVDPITSIVVALILFACGVRVIPRREKKVDEYSPLLNRDSV